MASDHSDSQAGGYGVCILEPAPTLGRCKPTKLSSLSLTTKTSNTLRGRKTGKIASILTFYPCCGKSIWSLCNGSSDRSLMASYFSFLQVLPDWCNKGHGMCYTVSKMVHIKEFLLIIGKSSPCGSSGSPLLLSEWSFTICFMSYNRKSNVLSGSLNKTFPSFVLTSFVSLLTPSPRSVLRTVNLSRKWI